MTLADDLADPARRSLWTAIPERTFVRLDGTNAFARRHVLVVVRTRDLIADAPLAEQDAGAFEFCRVGILTSGGVACAYVLRASGCRVRTRSNHLVLSVRGDVTRDPRVLYTDGTLGIVGDDVALVACLGGGASSR